MNSIYAFRDLTRQTPAARQLGPLSTAAASSRAAALPSREGGARGHSLPPLEVEHRHTDRDHEHQHQQPIKASTPHPPGTASTLPEESTSTVASLTFQLSPNRAAASSSMPEPSATLTDHLSSALLVLQQRQEQHRLHPTMDVALLSRSERDLLDGLRSLLGPSPTFDAVVETASSHSSKPKGSSSSGRGQAEPAPQASFALTASASSSDHSVSIRHLKRVDSNVTAKQLSVADLKGYMCDLARNSFRETSEGAAYVVPVEVDAAVLFIDITGYSALTTAMEAKGAYELSRVVNKVFTTLVQACVDLFLGDVAKFAGDAIVVVWPAGENVSVKECCLRAARCALYLQANHATFDVPGTDVKLAMHIGLSVGPLRSVVLQGHQLQHTQVNWHLLSGAPLNDIGAAADAAKPGEVVMTRAALDAWPDDSPEAKYFSIEVWRGEAGNNSHAGTAAPPQLFLISSHAEEALSPVSPGRGHGYHDTTFDGESDDEDAQLLPERAVLPDDYDAINEQRNLEGFIHPTILRRIESQTPADHMSEMRLLGVVFIHLTQPLDDISTWFAEVLSILDANRCGTVQIIDDDKGLHVIAAANLHAAVREPGKAVTDACAELVARRLGVTVGAAVGVVFCGLVGCEQARRWDVTGAACVRACRLMQHGITAGISVVLDSTVVDNVTDLSVLRPLPNTISVKGTPTPMVVYTLDATRNTAITLMPAFRSVTEPAVHSSVSQGLSALISDHTHQRLGAIISGPPGVGKAYLCQVALNDAAHGANRFVTLSLQCVAGDKLQFLRLVAVWFGQHVESEVRRHAADLNEALTLGHTHRATLSCVATVEAALFRNFSLAVIISQGQHLDAYSLGVLQQMLTSEPSPGSGRFAAFVTMVPELGGMSDATIATRLSARGFTPFRRRVGALDDDEANALVTRRLGWVASDRVRRVIKALSGNIAVCIDHTIAMIQRQRPYITHLRSDGVVDADDAAIDRIVTKPWQEISPALCARLQQNYDNLEPRLQRLLKAIATLENRAFAPPVVLVAAALAEFDPRGVALIGKDLTTLEELHMIGVHGPACASDYYSGEAEVDQATALRTDITWPSHIALRAESQKHAERLRTACVSFSNPAFRDTVRGLIVPPQRKGFLRVALHYSSIALDTVASPIAALFRAEWLQSMGGPEVNTHVAQLLTPALAALKSKVPPVRLSTSVVPTTIAVIAKLLTAHGTATTPQLVPLAAPSLMPMVVVFVKNYQPSFRLGPALGPFYDLCRSVKNLAIDVGNKRLVDRQTTLTALAALTAIDRVLCQYTWLLASPQLRADEFVSYNAESNRVASPLPAEVAPATGAISVNPRSRRQSSSAATAAVWRHPSIIPIGEKLAQITDTNSVAIFDTAMELLQAVWRWLEGTINPMNESIGKWVEQRATIPPEPCDPWVHDLRQRRVLERALGELCSVDGLSDAAVQRTILLLTSCAWDSGHPLVTVALLRDVLVFRRVETPLCLKSFLYMTLSLAR